MIKEKLISNKSDYFKNYGQLHPSDLSQLTKNESVDFLTKPNIIDFY